MRKASWLVTGAVAVGIVAATGIVGRGQFQPVGPTAGGFNPNDPSAAGAPVVMMNQQPAPTKLEAMLAVRGAVIVRGFSDVGGVDLGDNSGVGVQAVEVADVAKNAREHGLAVAVRQGGNNGRTVVTYVDYDEIDTLLTGIEYLQRVDNSVTPLPRYEARIKSRADL